MGKSILLIFVALDIAMNSLEKNSLEKKSFTSFLTLYILSSTLFLSLSAYWYYNAQKRNLHTTYHYQMQHLADKVSANVISAHMQGTPFSLQKSALFHIGLYTKENILKYGERYQAKANRELYISHGTNYHLGIHSVYIWSDTLDEELHKLFTFVLSIYLLTLFLIALIGWILSHLFLAPIRKKRLQIERFISDITHELNTPITALKMGSERALEKQVFDEKLLTNIAISTKQLYDIYTSLSYLNFNTKSEGATSIQLEDVLKESLLYYTPLAQSKKIDFVYNSEACQVTIPKSRLTLLLGNLLSNAIKYSHPQSTITITLHDKELTIKDYGIGIDPEVIDTIFTPYVRATQYSGGFGVGLSIVKRLCDEYGIDINVLSTLGEGSEFHLKFNN